LETFAFALDLSFQRATNPFNVEGVVPAVSENKVFESEESSHKQHFATVLGSNPEMDFVPGGFGINL
jgi:hypothetical protein